MGFQAIVESWQWSGDSLATSFIAILSALGIYVLSRKNKYTRMFAKVVVAIAVIVIAGLVFLKFAPRECAGGTGPGLNDDVRICKYKYEFLNDFSKWLNSTFS